MTKSMLDRPEILQVLFHPRQEFEATITSGAYAISIEVEAGVVLGGRLYPAGPEAPAILYFHGNGEIATDYDFVAPAYKALGLTLLVMDYRGYGRSGGRPTVTNLLSDAVAVFEALGRVFEDKGLSPSQLYVMGRSLGSAAAIEVALQAREAIAGMIIESGFADTLALLARLGARLVGVEPEQLGPDNGDKIEQVRVAALFIHGQADFLIPARDGQELHRRCGAANKQLVLIPGAGHNDLMMVGQQQYFQAIATFVHKRN